MLWRKKEIVEYERREGGGEEGERSERERRR